MAQAHAQQQIRIAMWSGPRTISTALMRSWGSRRDTAVCDEPFYAHYLHESGLPHPGRDAVLAAQPREWPRVVAALTGPIPDGKTIHYQKHMAHHLLPGIGREWLGAVTNAFLIRDPAELLPSLLRVTPEARLEDTGLPQQWELFQRVQERSGKRPPVIDARDVLEQPRALLEQLCGALGVPFDPAMLSWEPGPRASDGVWAPHWYAAVERSSGFEPYRAPREPLPPARQELLAQAREYYERLHEQRLRA